MDDRDQEACGITTERGEGSSSHTSGEYGHSQVCLQFCKFNMEMFLSFLIARCMCRWLGISEPECLLFVWLFFSTTLLCVR